METEKLSPAPGTDALAAVKQGYASFSDTERKIADLILRRPGDVVTMTLQSLAAQAGVSAGSVANFCSKAGFAGYTRLKLSLAQSLPQPAWSIDGAAAGDSARETMRKMAANASASFEDTWRALPEESLQRAAAALRQAARIEVYGVGASSMVAQDAAYRFLRVGLPAAAVTDALLCAVSAANCRKGVLAVGVSHSGRTQATVRAMEIAARHGAATLCLTSFAGSPLAQLCELPLVVVSREAGEHREAVASRLTQLLVVDSLCSYLSLQRPAESLEAIETVANIYEEYR